jgi:hypothetical protein
LLKFLVDLVLAEFRIVCLEEMVVGFLDHFVVWAVEAEEIGGGDEVGFVSFLF